MKPLDTVVMPDKVVDEHNGLHRLVEEIGRGGQGAVYTTSDPQILVKLIKTRSENATAELRERLGYIQTLPLDHMAIATPGAVLKDDHVGYVMPLLKGMVPLATLVNPPKEGSLAAWYIETGGLRRRLRILARLAEVLGRLHALSITYADLSPYNVFISESLTASELWLIDADNLSYRFSLDARIYTPGYGAPEVVQGKMANTTLSDMFSFAILAFQVLSTIHPFEGDIVHDGEPDMEDRAFAGLLPWVDDPEDDQNWTERGIPRGMLLTTRLRELFQSALGAGRMEPMARPGMTHWAEALYVAADLCIACPECKGSYFAPHAKTCPLCDAPRPEFIYISSYCWDPDAEEDNDFRVGKTATALWHAFADSNTDFAIPRRWTAPFLVETAGEKSLDVSVVPQGMVVEVIDGREYHIAIPGTKQCELLAGTKVLPVPSGKAAWIIHCGRMEEPHRILRVVSMGGTQG